MTNLSLPAVHVIGSGAIGSLISAYAANAGYSVTRHIRNQPVSVLTDLTQNKLSIETQLNQWPSETAQGMPPPIIILPLKSYQIASAIEQYRRYFPADSRIVLLHNGMGVHDHVAALLQHFYVFLGTTSESAYKPDFAQCLHTGTGRTDIGAVGTKHQQPANDDVITLFKRLFNQFEWHQDIYPALWHKLAVNALINPLTAIYDIPNGALAKDEYRSQLHVLANEISTLMQRHNIALSEQTIVARTLGVIQNTANNYSSMHQDIAHRRATEIGEINGFVVSQGKKLGLDCRHNQALVKRIRELESSF